MLIRRIENGDIEQILAVFATVADERVYIGTEPGFDRALYRARLESRVGDDAHPAACSWPRSTHGHNDAAIALYRATGYVEVERFPNDVTRRSGEVWDTVLMRKSFR